MLPPTLFPPVPGVVGLPVVVVVVPLLGVAVGFDLFLSLKEVFSFFVMTSPFFLCD